MLVLCVGMFRACSTWQYGVVGELIERHRSGQRLGFADGGIFTSAVEPTLDESRWSVLKAHDAHERFAERLSRGQALGIYSHRDLRDVAFSWMHKAGLTFDEIVERGFLEQCLRNDRFWRDRPGMLLQSYEGLIAEPARGVAEIARHLGIEIGPGEDREIADLLSFEANRKRTRDIAQRLQSEGVALDSKDLDRYDRKTLLHWNHIRDGRAGSWRDEVETPEQEATLARICGPWLVQQGYEPGPDRPSPDGSTAEPPRETVSRVSFAHNMEDILLDRMFRGRKGTYINVGADHPTLNNNTYYFYLRGWRGVNAEPVRSAFDLFGERRPADLNLQVAISDSDGGASLEATDPDEPSLEMAEAGGGKGLGIVEPVVPSRTIASLIDQHGLVPPDIFSIDVEGGEGRVLRGVPLATWRPKVFVIEVTRTTDIPGQEAWEPILTGHGYLFAAYDGINRFYLRGDLADSLRHFDRPVNALDDYVTADTFDQRERADLLQGLLDEERRQGEEARVRLSEEQMQLAELKARLSEQLEARHRDYLTWMGEREAWKVEREVGEAERDTLARRVEALEGERATSAREVDSLHGVIGRLQGEIRDRDVDLDRTRARLRPYLKLDRLGVVPALQRKVFAHRAHAKM